MATAARRDQQLILRNLPCKVGWFVLNHPTSSDKSCHLIPPVLRLKSVVHFDPLISGVALCAQKAGQGVCRQRSPATGFEKPATSSCPSLILFLFLSFEGTPVFSNLLLTILVICTWGALMYFTQKDRCTQRVALIINMVLGGVSLIAFVLSFWDVNSQVVLWIGFPCEILFYGFKLFWDWICIYSVVTVLAIVGIEYSKRNLSEQSTK